MKEVNFYRGIKNKYNKALYENGIYFATDTKEIIVDGVSYGSVDVDDELTEIGKNPVTGSSIYKAIKDNISNAIDTAPYGAKIRITNANNVYQLYLLDKNDNILSSGEIVGDQSGAYDPSGLRFELLSNQDQQVKVGQKALVNFTFDVKDSSGSSLGRSGTISLVKDAEGNDPIYIQEVNPGQSSIDVTEYLTDGTVTKFWLVASAETDKGIQTVSKYFTVRLVNISITSTHPVDVVTKSGDIIQIPFTITGVNDTKVVRAYLNGVEAANVEVSTASSSQSISVRTTGLSHGTHNIQLRADYEIKDDYGNVETTVYSNIIYFDVIVIEEGNKTPLFSCRFDYENGENLISGTPIVNVKQYDLFNLSYFVYNTNATREVEFYSDGNSIGSNTFSDAASTIKYRYTTSGIKTCYFECDGYTYDFVVNVAKSNYSISEPTSSLALYLDALGKSNSSSVRDQWTYNNVTSEFEGFNWSGNGWTGDSLKLFNGSKVTINHQPFKPATSGALAFTIRLKVDNVSDPDEVLVSSVDEYGNGLTITAQEAKLKTQSSEVSTKFASGQIYNIGFVSFPAATSNSNQDGINNDRMCYVYVDGVISGGVQKLLANDIYQVVPQNITIQASKCELEIYSIRSYSTELNEDEMFNCYLIDLVNSKAIADKYEFNDVLNLQGVITVDKVHGKIPYFVITGPSVVTGRSQFEHVAIVNDKDPKYDVDSILYVDTDPAFNFYCVPGEKNPQIRLQGTSSMAYPRKNYRIYTKNAQLYLGCDKNGEGGQLQNKPNYSLSATAAPVNCWCLKADAAESSSSHNTGTTGLVEEVLNKIDFLTPAQKYVDKEKYPYQVRTTVEGHPCLVFYRNSVSDQPVFGGKYNFNNDKSTEDVFGFLDIPGYNDNEAFAEDMQKATNKSMIWGDFESTTYNDDGKEVTVTKTELIKMLGKNPTECWEFSNNSTRMGNFLEADFDKIDPDSSKGELYWMTSWEARFPDEDGLNAAFKAGVKPYYLMNTAKWITSTNISQATGKLLDSPVTYGGVQYSYDNVEYRQAKFRSELSNYFDVNYLCAYYLFTDCLAAADQRVKNMMWGFWYNPDVTEHEIMGKVRCYPIFYDNDTILGLDNTGKIALNWDVDENTMNGEAPAFAGHDSTIWINLRSQFAKELEEVYVTMSSGSNFVGATMLKWYNTNQSDRYCERIYNKDALYKYIVPFNVGVDVVDESGTLKHVTYDYLNQMHGSRRAHRSWFIDNRMDLFNARYQGGNYKEAEIKWKGAVVPGEGENISLSLETSREYYVAIHSDMTGQLTHQKVEAGNKLNVILNADKVDIGAIYHIYGIRWLKELDLSNWGGFESLEASSVMPTLETLILGGHRGSATGFSTTIFDKVPSLKYLDMTNIKLSSVDLTLCPYLETLIATGTNLTSVLFAEGSNVSDIYLPSTFTNLSLVGLPKITNTGVHFENSDNLLRLRVEKCEKFNGLTMLNSIISSNTNNLKYVRITDLNISGNGQDLLLYKQKGLLGLDSYGNPVLNKCKLVGTYKLTTLLDDAVHKELCEYFDELDIQQPEYTIISFNCAQATSEKVTNYDNSTGYEFGNDYKYSGHIAKILDQRHSYLVKYPISYPSGEFAAIQLDDNDSNKFTDGTIALLDGTYGDFCMYEPHYWYKGVNDHKKQTLYLLFSSNKECPKQANGKKITIADCVLRSGYGASTGNQYLTDSQSIVAQQDYNLYSYVLPEGHKYKQFRVSSVTSANYGCIVVDKNGNIKQRLSQAGNAGMYDTSYLFDSLHPEAYKIYMTINKNTISEYCLYLTESSDIEAIEPDWVEHKECFVGRVFSTLYEGEVKSAIYNNISPENWATTGFYPQVSGLSVRQVNNAISSSGKGYYAADYEVFKDIINLAYARYGSTGLHSNHVGAGADANGKFDMYYVSRYFPNPNVKSTEYGINDTITDQVFESYYSLESDVKEYPGTATLMGYYHFVGQGSMTSYLDKINMSTKMFSNERTGRTLKLYTGSSAIYNKNILGGRYFDIFGSSSQYGATSSNDGFCGREYTTNNNITTALVSIGYRASSTGVQSYNLQTTDTERANTSTNISYNDIINAQRILIIPDKVTYFNTISEYNSL